MGMQERRFKMIPKALACTTANVSGHQMRETEQKVSLCRGMNRESFILALLRLACPLGG